MKFLADIFDYLTDEDTVAGFATGVSEQLDRSEARRDKTLDQLRTYGLEKINRQEQEYMNDLDENEEQVKLLAAKLATPEHSANSQQVLAAAQYLIQNFTLAGAQAEADRLRSQYLKFNLNPLVDIGNAALENGQTLSVRSMASGLTRRPAPVNVADSGFPVQPSLTDRLFGGPTVEEEAQQSVEAMQSLIPNEDALPIIAQTGYDADLIIRPDVPLRQEIIRLKEMMADAQKAKNVPKQKVIASKILVLEEEEIAGRRGEAKEFTDTQYNRANGNIIETIGQIYNMKTKGDLIRGDRITFEEATDASAEALKFGAQATVDLSNIQKSGNANMSEEREKILLAISMNRQYTVIEKEIVVGVADLNQETRTFGILTIQLSDDENAKLFENEYFADKEAQRSQGGANGQIITKPQDDTQNDTQDASGADGDSSAEAYVPDGDTISTQKSTGINITDKRVTDAVAAFKNLPTSVGGLDKNRARRAVVQAIIDVNPTIDPREARRQANILLGD
jgi:hypothetical protein